MRQYGIVITLMLGLFPSLAVAQATPAINVGVLVGVNSESISSIGQEATAPVSLTNSVRLFFASRSDLLSDTAAFVQYPQTALRTSILPDGGAYTQQAAGATPATRALKTNWLTVGLGVGMAIAGVIIAAQAPSAPESCGGGVCVIPGPSTQFRIGVTIAAAGGVTALLGFLGK